MEKVLTTNNGQAGWDKLETFGLHFRSRHIGFNRYAGRNGAVLKVDPATGMRVMLIPASIPRTERAPKVPGKRGRPAIVGCVQQFEGKKRGRPAKIGCIMFRNAGKRGRPAFIGPREQLIFVSHPQQKRGPKPLSAEEKALKAAERANNSTETLVTPQKRGRMTEKERIAAANVGEVIKANGGGYWKIIVKGLASYISA